MGYGIKDMLEMPLMILLFGLSIGQLIFSQDLFYQGARDLPTTETVYLEANNVQSQNDDWKGSQIIVFLRETDLNEVPVQVGGVLFETDKQVEELWSYIQPNGSYKMTPDITGNGEISKIQFTLN